MKRDEAFALVKKHATNKNLIKHMLATEAVMKRLAQRLDQDEEQWALSGLLHDLDYDVTANDFARHGLITAEILESEDVQESVIHAIKSHPGHFPRESLMDKALYAADPVTGLIVAAALMHPTKKLENVDVDFIQRRFKEKRFAAGADRDQIQSCETLNISLDEFLALSLEAMQGVASDLGL